MTKNHIRRVGVGGVSIQSVSKNSIRSICFFVGLCLQISHGTIFDVSMAMISSVVFRLEPLRILWEIRFMEIGRKASSSCDSIRRSLEGK